MPRTLRLLKNNVWLRPIQPPRLTASGLLLREYDDRDLQQFIIVDVSPAVKAKGELRRGQRVIAPLHFDWWPLPDGSKITDASQVQLIVEGDGRDGIVDFG